MSLLSKIVTSGILAQVLLLAACGGDDEKPSSPGGSGGEDAGSGGAGGGASGSGGASGDASAQTTGYSSQLGVPPDTRLEDLEPDQFRIACEAYNIYFNEQIPQTDQVRAVCVADAVFQQGAATVDDCTQTSDACIAAVQGFPPPQCVPPENATGCPATLREYETCATDLVEQEKNRVALLVCGSIEDPEINDKLAAASGVPSSCTNFAENCPAFFPAPLPPDGGAATDGG